MFSSRVRCIIAGIAGVLILSQVIGCSKDEKSTKPHNKPQVTYNFTGLVVDDTGSGVSGATVSYRFGSKSGSSITDGLGNYIFTNLAVGTYTIDITKSGYTSERIEAQITEDGALVPDAVIQSFSTIAERVEETVSAASGFMT